MGNDTYSDEVELMIKSSTDSVDKKCHDVVKIEKRNTVWNIVENCEYEFEFGRKEGKR